MQLGRRRSASRCRRSRSARRGPCRTSSPRPSRRRRALGTGCLAGCRAPCRHAAACRASTRRSAAWCDAPSRRPTRRGSRRSRRRKPVHPCGRWRGARRSGPGSHRRRSALRHARRWSLCGASDRCNRLQHIARRVLAHRGPAARKGLVAWDANRPVPWQRLVREWLIYVTIMAVVFVVFFRDRGLLGILAGLLASGPLYLAIGYALAKLGYQRQAAQGPAERVPPGGGRAASPTRPTDPVRDRRRRSGRAAAPDRTDPASGVADRRTRPIPATSTPRRSRLGYGREREHRHLHRHLCDRDRCRHDRGAQPGRVRRRARHRRVVPRVHPALPAARLGGTRCHRDLGRGRSPP